jgi:hypothetical protein
MPSKGILLGPSHAESVLIVRGEDRRRRANCQLLLFFLLSREEVYAGHALFGAVFYFLIE